MPCRGRSDLAALAVESFLTQTYPNKELVISDDGDLPAFPNGITGEGIRYYCGSVSLRYQIPAKRNQVNELAAGEIICHWDSDDWSRPDRMAHQVERLEETGKAVTGYCTLLFHEPSSGRNFEYQIKSNYVCGTSLCYLKSWWAENKFLNSKPIASDNPFVYAASRAKQLDAVPCEDRMVARIHGDNTSPKSNRGPNYVEIFSALPAGFPVAVSA